MTKSEMIDVIHGPVVDFIVTDEAYIFVHDDGFKEVIIQDEMEIQEVC